MGGGFERFRAQYYKRTVLNGMLSKAVIWMRWRKMTGEIEIGDSKGSREVY